jgi:hypothetical protein
MERKDKCDCPLLRMAAEIERMAGCGIVPAEGDSAMERRVAAIAIGKLRNERGCSGPSFGGACPHYYTKWDVDLTVDPNVPLLRRKVDDKQGHKYL